MSDYWHAITVARFSWLDLAIIFALITAYELGKAFIRGWRRSAERERRSGNP